LMKSPTMPHMRKSSGECRLHHVRGEAARQPW
jgi:hypothetical protein